MPQPGLGGIGPGASYEDLLNYVIRLERKLDYVLQNMDSENIFEVGGWRVTPDQLASKDNDVGMSTEDTAADDIRFWAGDVITGSPKFTVTKSGILTAVDGNFEGTITADSGTIGGWVIAADSLKDAAGTVGMSSAVTGGDDIRFFAGNSTPSSAPFRVTEAGALTASSGTIGGFTITSTDLTATTGGTIQNKSAAANKVYLNDTGFHANDASGVERLTIGTTPAQGAKALIGRDSSGTQQSVITYDTETVDSASRTGQFITAHGAYILLGNDGDIRIQAADGKGFRAVSGTPEMNDGFGWITIATSGVSTSTHVQPNHNHGITGGVQLATTADGSTVNGFVTWVESGGFSHSHTQT
jgi:hypothetical protein